MKSQRSVEDLIALSRRGQLSDADGRALQSQLQSSLEARLLLDAGRSFDAARAVESGDELHVERLASFAVGAVAAKASAKQPHLPSRRGGIPQSVVARVMAGVVLFSAAAAGAWSTVGIVLQRRDAAVEQARRVHTGGNAAAKAQRARGTSEGAPSSSTPFASEIEPSEATERVSARAATADSSSEVEPPEATERVDARAVTQIPSPGLGSEGSVRPMARRASEGETVGAVQAGSSAPAPTTTRTSFDGNTPSATAAQLFASANLARRARDTDRAIALYERLQQVFPESPEARECSLILGTLQLERAPAAALRQFRRYGSETSSAFGADALWGEARALRNLGRTQAERDALSRLVSSFPNAPYADAARHRLRELAP
jgi:TolA-binding protein